MDNPVGYMSGLDKESQAKQVKVLNLCFSCETLTIVNKLSVTTEQSGKVTTTVQSILRYVEGHINESVKCRNFRQWVQSFDDFLVSLQELAKTSSSAPMGALRKNLRSDYRRPLRQRHYQISLTAGGPHVVHSHH